GHQRGPVLLQAGVALGPAMRRSVIHDPENVPRRPVGLLAHDVCNKTVKGLNSRARLTPAKEPCAMDIPRGDIGPSATPVVFVLHSHRSARRRRPRGVAALAR